MVEWAGVPSSRFLLPTILQMEHGRIRNLVTPLGTMEFAMFDLETTALHSAVRANAQRPHPRPLSRKRARGDFRAGP